MTEVRPGAFDCFSVSCVNIQACHDEWNEDCKIFVGGLGEEGTRIELDDAFGKFGPIKNIWLAKAPPSFAYIEMEVSTKCKYSLN